MRLLAQELFEAACAGNTALVEEGLSELSKDDQQAWLKDAMLRATYEGRDGAVQALLQIGASPAVTDGLGQTALHWASRKGFEAIAKCLVKAKANVSSANNDGFRPLHLAAQFNAGPVVQLLLTHKADPADLTVDKRNALHLSAEHGAAVAAAVLLEATKTEGSDETYKPPAILEHETDRGETPLARAAAKGNGAVVQLLLRAGADMQHKNYFGQAPLHLSCFGGHVGAAAVLLDQQADANATAQDGSTAMHAAVERGQSQVVELLISHGADLRFTASGGRTALHVASERGFADTVEALLAASADTEVRTEEARTPLSYAAARGHIAAVVKLLENHADVQALDNMKQTALHAAAAAGRAECIEHLHKKRARLEQTDGSNRTPMQLALDGHQDAAIRALLKLGAVLPEEVAAKPEMQPMIREVEHEVLKEQLKAAAENAGQKQIKAAKQAFEEARVHLLKLTVLGATAAVTPIIHHAEIRLQDAKELNRTSKTATSELQEQLKQINAELARLQLEAKERQKDIDMTRRDLGNMRDAKGKRMEELSTLKKDIERAIAALADARAKETGLDGETKSAEKRIESLKKTLANLQEKGDAIQSQLYETTAQVDTWIAEKEKVAELHAKAHELLNKPGKQYGYPGSPAESMPASPSKGAEAAAVAEEAPAAEAPAETPKQ